MYFKLLAFLALLISGVVAQECYVFNATWTKPMVCNPTYNATASAASNATAGDALSSFFSTLTTSTLPSRQCAEAYAKYYCNINYPECDSDNTTLPTCTSACTAVLAACNETSDIAVFEGTSFTLPTTCSNVTAACSTPRAVVLTNYYASCSAVNHTNVTAFGQTNEANVVCRPTYTVPNLLPINYQNATTVFNSLRGFSDNYQNEIPNSLYPCLKAFTAYYCVSNAFPPCNDNQALPSPQLCADACRTLLEECTDYNDYFAASPTLLQLPALSVCNSYPTTNCFSPSSNDTYVGFFFNSADPPTDAPPTEAPEPEPPASSDDIYPPGGAGTGGGIGAGVLVGLLIVIGLVMLIMKKQDSR